MWPLMSPSSSGHLTEGVKGMQLCLGDAAKGFGAVPRDGSSSPLGDGLRTCLH